MIPMKDLLPTTGYIRGACSPIGMKKNFPTFIHSSCTNFDTIYISGGQRGLQIAINPTDLLSVIETLVVDLVEEVIEGESYI